MYKNLINLYYITSASGAFDVSFPIILDFLIIPESIQSPLKLFTELALTTVSDKLFHSVLTLLEKENLRRPYPHMILSYFVYVRLLPLVIAAGIILNFKVISLSCLFLIILYISIISPLSLQYFNVSIVRRSL